MAYLRDFLDNLLKDDVGPNLAETIKEVAKEVVEGENDLIVEDILTGWLWINENPDAIRPL